MVYQYSINYNHHCIPQCHLSLCCVQPVYLLYIYQVNSVYDSVRFPVCNIEDQQCIMITGSCWYKTWKCAQYELHWAKKQPKVNSDDLLIDTVDWSVSYVCTENVAFKNEGYTYNVCILIVSLTTKFFQIHKYR